VSKYANPMAWKKVQVQTVGAPPLMKACRDESTLSTRVKWEWQIPLGNPYKSEACHLNLYVENTSPVVPEDQKIMAVSFLMSTSTGSG